MKQQKHYPEPPEDVLNNFNKEDQPRMQELWDKSRAYAPDPKELVSDEEVEAALHTVHKKMDQSENNRSSITPLWGKWLAAAAAVLIMLISGYLMIPRTASAPYGELVSIELPDGTQVELNSGSEISYSRLYQHINRDVALDGEAFFIVEEGDHPFTVESNDAKIEVTGTRFNVRSWSEEPDRRTEVSVSSGNVRLYPSDQPENHVLLNKGTWSQWNPEMDAPSSPKEIASDELAGWRNNRLSFDDQPLWKIFREVERRFDVQIQLEQEGIASETLSTHYYDPETAQSIIEDISQIKGLRYSETANGYRVYR